MQQFFRLLRHQMPDIVLGCILILCHGLVSNSTSSYSNFARYTFWRSKNTPLYLAFLVLGVRPVVELLPFHLLVLSLLLQLFYSLCFFQSFFFLYSRCWAIISFFDMGLLPLSSFAFLPSSTGLRFSNGVTSALP